LKSPVLPDLVDFIRSSEQFAQKLSIMSVIGGSDPGFCDQRILNGDDAAAIPEDDGFLLLAAEGIVPSLVLFDPFFAGRSAVLANVNDIYSMGGRPIAIVDVISAEDNVINSEIFRGMTDFSKRLRVPVVGGHTLITEGNPFVSLAILGKARKIITSFDANPGDRMALIYNPDGKWMDDLGFWNSLPSRSGPEHIEDLELIPQAAESELVQAGKDVSMSGIIGTALMFVEASGVGARIDLDCIPMPEGVHPGRWLLAYFSYGFLLAVSEERWGQVVDLFSLRSLEVRQIGSFCEGSQLVLSSEGRQEALWDWSVEPFLGLQRV
jgi:AIR synthase-related protein